MSKHLWMPLDIDAYLGDTDHLSLVEHGAYLLLIMRYWKDRGLPTDERLIARYAHMSVDQWAESRAVLAAFFDDQWRHKRIDEELAKADEITSKRKSAAEQRHSKRNANAEQMESKSTYTRVPPITTEPSSSLRSDDPPQKRGTRLPDDWSLPDEWRQDALDAGLPAERIDLEAMKMRDWSRSATGTAPIKREWRSAWRNWCRRAASEAQKARASPSGGGVRAVIGNLRQELANAVTDAENGRDRQTPLRLSHG